MCGVKDLWLGRNGRALALGSTSTVNGQRPRPASYMRSWNETVKEWEWKDKEGGGQGM